MSTVFRLPEEPPVGTTVRPEPDTGKRYTRHASGQWGQEQARQPGMLNITFRFGWGWVLDACKGGVVVVEPDPHPTPWTVGGVDEAYLVDANEQVVLRLQRPCGYTGRNDRLKFDLAERIVKAVNEATP